MKANAHSQSIPDAVITAADAALTAQLQAITPYSTPLTADDRHDILKTGPKTFLFVKKAHDLASQNPGLTSKSFDMDAFSKDFADVQGLTALLNKSRQFTEMLEDIVMTAGSEAHHAALEFYADVKSATARNVPEARAVYEELKAVYPNKGRKSKEPAETQT